MVVSRVPVGVSGATVAAKARVMTFPPAACRTVGTVQVTVGETQVPPSETVSGTTASAGGIPPVRVKGTLVATPPGLVTARV